MISVDEAKALVAKHSIPLPVVEVPLEDSFNMVLAMDVLSAINMPSFAQSAMDGYAIRFDDIAATEHLTVTGEVQAGANIDPAYTTHAAIRIFTGAPVPSEFDTVVIQEHCQRDGYHLFVDSPNLKKTSNIRPVGSEIKANEVALTKGTLLTAGAIGFLRGLGITSVEVFSKPKLTIIVTGKELVQAGKELRYGQIYESNALMLQKALQQFHLKDVQVVTVDDEPDLIKAAIKEALTNSDLLLLTGGVSVGDYDFVTDALKQSGVDIVFHKVKQKPGKPLLFGKTQSCTVFGLPGNPSSVLTCFYQYVSIALANLTGRNVPYLMALTTALANDFEKPAGLTHFLKGDFKNGQVYLLPAQESFRLSSFAVANCIVEIPESTTLINQGDEVTIYLLPI